jgi:hypothetical protein
LMGHLAAEFSGAGEEEGRKAVGLLVVRHCWSLWLFPPSIPPTCKSWDCSPKGGRIVVAPSDPERPQKSLPQEPDGYGRGGRHAKEG